MHNIGLYQHRFGYLFVLALMWCNQIIKLWYELLFQHQFSPNWVQNVPLGIVCFASKSHPCRCIFAQTMRFWRIFKRCIWTHSSSRLVFSSLKLYFLTFFFSIFVKAKHINRNYSKCHAFVLWHFNFHKPLVQKLSRSISIS